jgi:hypothetical protein
MGFLPFGDVPDGVLPTKAVGSTRRSVNILGAAARPW